MIPSAPVVHGKLYPRMARKFSNAGISRPIAKAQIMRFEIDWLAHQQVQKNG